MLRFIVGIICKDDIVCLLRGVHPFNIGLICTYEEPIRIPPGPHLWSALFVCALDVWPSVAASKYVARNSYGIKEYELSTNGLAEPDSHSKGLHVKNCR